MEPMDLAPSDVEQQRHQINYDLSILMKRPIPSHSTPVAQGMGLYTHVAATTDSNDKRTSIGATFLPLGGPRKLQKWQQTHDSLPYEVKQAWNQMQRVLDDEEGAMKNVVHHPTRLRERYGGLTALEAVVSTALAHTTNKQGHTASTDTSNANTLKRRRSSVSLQQPTGKTHDTDAVTHSTPTEHGPSVHKRHHFYEADRDPRRRG